MESDEFSSNEDHSHYSEKIPRKRRLEDGVQDTLKASGINADNDEYIYDRRESDMNDEQKRRQEEHKERMEKLKSIPATFEDLKKIVLRRSKIEEWIDEPFFNKTIKNLFVKIGFSSKYLIAEVIDIKDDSSAQYSLTNGKKTGIFVQLLLTEKTSDKMKWFKLIQISNQEITQDEFEKFWRFREFYKVPLVSLEQVERKSKDITNARNYVYGAGETEKIANKKFERALKEGALNQFPNVTYFLKKKQGEVNFLKNLLTEWDELHDKENVAKEKVINRVYSLADEIQGSQMRKGQFNQTLVESIIIKLESDIQ